MQAEWVKPNAEGIYIAPAGLWIDPSTPKDFAAVTHGHADHARGGHGRVLATPSPLSGPLAEVVAPARFENRARRRGLVPGRAPV